MCFVVIPPVTKFHLVNERCGFHQEFKFVVVVMTFQKITNQVQLNEPLKASVAQVFDRLTVDEHRFVLRASALFYERDVVDQHTCCNNTCARYEQWDSELKC